MFSIIWPQFAKLSNGLKGSLLHQRPYECSRIIFRGSHFTPKEISIPVPWGHVAGLHWNDDKSATPLFCLHGWKDNAASFNRLIPLILAETKKYQFICIDLPGHGFSSFYAPGMIYQSVDSLIMIRRVAKHFGVSDEHRVHLMGHSLGAILAFLFAATHPSEIHSVIAIDALVPVTFSFTKPELTLIAQKVTDGILSLESSPQAPGVDKTELLETWLKSHMRGINKEACEELITRGVIEDPVNAGKFRYAHDQRVQFMPLMEYGADYIKHLALAFQTNLLHFKCENGVNYLTETTEEKVKEWIRKGNKKLVRYVQVNEAKHHVHLMEPEKIVPDILKFLAETRIQN